LGSEVAGIRRLLESEVAEQSWDFLDIALQHFEGLAIEVPTEALHSTRMAAEIVEPKASGA
jgi:hypothetical protein